MQASCAAVCRYPATQKHLSMLPLPATEVELRGQALHVATDTAATSVEYVLEGHCAQVHKPSV